MTDVSRKPRARTSRLTWAVAVGVLVAAIVGGAWAYFTVGPGRTVDTSGIQPGMKMVEVENILGQPDDVVASDDEAAWRYGRTHVWFRGVPGRGSVVSDVTVGPREPGANTNSGPKTKDPLGPSKPGERRPPGSGRPKSSDTEK